MLQSRRGRRRSASVASRSQIERPQLRPPIEAGLATSRPSRRVRRRATRSSSVQDEIRRDRSPCVALTSSPDGQTYIPSNVELIFLPRPSQLAGVDVRDLLGPRQAIGRTKLAPGNPCRLGGRTVLIVKIRYYNREHFFAFTFGHGRFLLRPDSYDRNYGLRVALNVMYGSDSSEVGNSKMSMGLLLGITR